MSSEYRAGGRQSAASARAASGHIPLRRGWVCSSQRSPQEGDWRLPRIAAGMVGVGSRECRRQVARSNAAPNMWVTRGLPLDRLRLGGTGVGHRSRWDRRKTHCRGPHCC